MSNGEKPWFALVDMSGALGSKYPCVELRVNVSEPGLETRTVSASADGNSGEPYSTNMLFAALQDVVGGECVLTGFDMRTLTARADTEVAVSITLASGRTSMTARSEGEGIFRVIANAYLAAASKIAERQHQAFLEKCGEGELPTKAAAD